MKKYRFISFLLVLFLSLSNFVYADDIYNNSRAMKIKSDNVGGIAIPGVKIVVGEDNTDGGYIQSSDGKIFTINMSHLDAARHGLLSDHEYIRIMGHNHDLGTVDEEISALGTLVWGNWPAAAAGVVLVSTDVDDDGDPADTGARTVIIRGLEDNAGVWTPVTATVTMNGTTPTAATAQTFIRIDKIEVVTCGSSLSNEGTITASISGVNIMSIYPKHSNSAAGRRTVASGTTVHIENIEVSAVGNKEVTYHIFCRDNAVANSPFLLRGSWHSNNSGSTPNGHLDAFTEKVDIIFIGHATLAGATASMSVEGYIEDN